MRFSSVLTLADAAELKAAAAAQCAATLHFHDACGGQSFSLDAPATPELRELAKSCAAKLGFSVHEGVYFFMPGPQFAAQKGGRAVFDNDGLSFRVVHRD